MGQTKVEAHPKEALPNTNEENIHFTEIDSKSGIMKGYKIDQDFDVVLLWQVNLIMSGDAKLMQVRSMH
jgi:hypothetical protein